MKTRSPVTLFLCGDFMSGRGVDQILPHSCPPRLYEPQVRSAFEYVALAERERGAMSRAVPAEYVWGDALGVFDRLRPEASIINLETAITLSEVALPKGINYRMHPANVAVLTAARIDCCVLANNHVLDWGRSGLAETRQTLARAGISSTGAGADLREAQQPVTLELNGRGRVLVFAMGAFDSGIPASWSAGPARPGVHLLPDFSTNTIEALAALIAPARRTGDVVVASIHWGSNWGFDIPAEHQRFAHALIDRAGVDLVHGHSSHHPKAIEIYNDRAIFYGCGDFLNDYEGVRGYEEFRDDLVLMYFPTVDVLTGRLLQLQMCPLQIRKFRLTRPTAADWAWLTHTLDRECRRFGARVVVRDELLRLDTRFE